MVQPVDRWATWWNWLRLSYNKFQVSSSPSCFPANSPSEETSGLPPTSVGERWSIDLSTYLYCSFKWVRLVWRWWNSEGSRFGAAFCLCPRCELALRRCKASFAEALQSFHSLVRRGVRWGGFGDRSLCMHASEPRWQILGTLKLYCVSRIPQLSVCFTFWRMQVSSTMPALESLDFDRARACFDWLTDWLTGMHSSRGSDL